MNETFFSLKDLIEMPEYQPVRILNLAPNPEQIEVRHVTSIERAAKGFIRRGEYVLTTAASWTTEEDFMRLVQDIYLGGAVAIAFSFIDNVDYVPECVKQFAREKQFTLIELAWQYRFADIISDVLKRIEHHQRQIIESWNELQNELLTSYLHRSSLGMAVRIISNHLHSDVLLTDARYRPLAFSGSNNLGAEALSPEKLADFHYFAALTQRGLTLAHLYLSKRHFSLQQIETFKPFSSSILVPVLLWFDREDIVQSTRTKLIDDLIWELASGSFSYSEDDYSRARTLGLHLNSAYRCIVGYICLKNSDVSNTWLDENADDIKRYIIEARWTAMVTVRNHYIIAYVGNDEDPQAHIKRFSAAITAFNPDMGCAWGVSGGNNKRTFEKIYQEARLCADVCRVERGPGNLYSTSDTGIFRVLFPAMKSHDTMQHIQGYLEPILSLEPIKREEVFRILNCYFANNFNACETARALFYNRQTLRYKLKKAEELLGISLDKHEQALYLELCLRIYELAQSGAFGFTQF